MNTDERGLFPLYWLLDCYMIKAYRFNVKYLSYTEPHYEMHVAYIIITEKCQILRKNASYKPLVGPLFTLPSWADKICLIYVQCSNIPRK